MVCTISFSLLFWSRSPTIDGVVVYVLVVEKKRLIVGLKLEALAFEFCFEV
jgi:hypothetical protein